MTLPVALTALILLALAVDQLGRRRSRVRTDERHDRVVQWGRRVAAKLPAAVDVVQLPTVAAKERREPIVMQQMRILPGAVGVQWRVQTPGGATITDLRQRLRAVESALNRPSPLVAVMDVQADPRHEGWGTLRAYRSDPIHDPRPIGEVCEPGGRLMRSPTSTMLVGVTRWGEHVRLPLWQHSMLVAGQTRAGKSSAVMTMLANLLPHIVDGTARVRLVDVSAKQGLGYGWMRDAGLLHSWATTPKDTFAVMAEMTDDLSARVSPSVDSVVPIGRAHPLDVLIVEEGPAALAVKGFADRLTDLARQVAALGGVVVFVSQGGVEVPITLRRQLRTRVAFRLDDHTESRNVLTGLPEGAHGPHDIPATTGVGGTVDWRGVSYVDDDGTGVRMVRWWHVDPAWLRQHAAALRRP